jgi:amino acid permease
MGCSYSISEKSGKSFVLYFQLFLAFIPYRSRTTHTHTQYQITFVVFFFFVIFQRDKNISQRNSGADSDRETHSNDSSNQRAKKNNKKQSEKRPKKVFFLEAEKNYSHFSLFAWGR